MARVTVSVNVRDMTGGDLARLRGRFNGLADSMNRFAGDQSQGNLRDMRNEFRDLDDQVQRLRGHIPEDEFQRLSDRTREFGDQVNSLGGPTSAQRLGAMRESLRDINTEVGRFERDVTTRARVDDDTSGGLARVRRSITRFASSFGESLRRTFADGISNGLGNGLRAAMQHPAVIAGVVGLATVLAGFLAAAIAGALVLALGGAFVALGVMIALQAEGVKASWTRTLNELKPLFADAAKPMIPVIEYARARFEDMAKEFAPHFKTAMEAAAPHVESFIEKTKDGFRQLGQNAWKDLQDSFRVFLVAFGPEWEDFLAEMGNSLGALSRTVAAHSSEIAMALRGVFGVVNILIDVVNFFAVAWADAIRIVSVSFGGLVAFVSAMASSIIFALELIIEGLYRIAAPFPIIGDKLRKAKEEFGSFRDDVHAKLGAISQAAITYGARLDAANKKRKLEVDIASWTRELESAKARLASVPKEKRSALKADIADLQNKIARANQALANMRKAYTITVHYRTTGSPYPPSGGREGGRAHGGVIGRAATGGVRNNMTLVGEHGAELVDLPVGSRVRSNPDTRRILSEGGSGGGVPQVVFRSSGRRADDLILELVRDAIHQRGGDPVTVLGGRR